jgi:hypothetical protein
MERRGKGGGTHRKRKKHLRHYGYIWITGYRFFLFLFDWVSWVAAGYFGSAGFCGFFGKSKHAKELGEFMFSSQQLYSPATRRDGPALVLYSRSFVSKKVNIHFSSLPYALPALS